MNILLLRLFTKNVYSLFHLILSTFPSKTGLTSNCFFWPDLAAAIRCPVRVLISKQVLWIWKLICILLEFSRIFRVECQIWKWPRFSLMRLAVGNVFGGNKESLCQKTNSKNSMKKKTTILMFTMTTSFLMTNWHISSWTRLAISRHWIRLRSSLIPIFYFGINRSTVTRSGCLVRASAPDCMILK